MRHQFRNIWISIEVQTRNDLRALVGVGAELRELGFVVSFHSGKIGHIPVRNWMAEYRPDVLVLRGMSWGFRYMSYFDANTGGEYRPLIIIIPAEFTYSVFSPEIRKELHRKPTNREVGSSIDLVLCIHQEEKQFITDTWSSISDSTVIPVGLPAFDRFAHQQPSKEDSKRIIGIPEADIARNIVLIASRSATADYENEERHLNMLRRAKEFMGTPPEYVKQVIQFHVLLSICFISATKELAKNCPDTIFCFKPHPAENENRYQEAFAGIENIRIIKSSGVSMTDLILIADLLIGYRCGSFLEASIANVPIVNFKPELVDDTGNKFELAYKAHPQSFDNLARWTVNHPRQLVDLCSKYVSLDESGFKEYRTVISSGGLKLENMIGLLDGKSSQRAAGEIAKLLDQSSRCRDNQSNIRNKDRLFLAKATNRAYLTGYFQPYRIRTNAFSSIRHIILILLKRLKKNVRKVFYFKSSDSTNPINVEDEMQAYLNNRRM